MHLTKILRVVTFAVLRPLWFYQVCQGHGTRKCNMITLDKDGNIGVEENWYSWERSEVTLKLDDGAASQNGVFCDKSEGGAP